MITLNGNGKWKIKDDFGSHNDVIHFISFCVGKIIESYTKDDGSGYKTPWCESSAPDSRSLQLYAIMKLIGDSKLPHDDKSFIDLKQECNKLIGHNYNIEHKELKSFWNQKRAAILQKYLHEVVDKYESKLVEPHNK